MSCPVVILCAKRHRDISIINQDWRSLLNCLPVFRKLHIQLVKQRLVIETADPIRCIGDSINTFHTIITVVHRCKQGIDIVLSPCRILIH